MQIIRIPKFVLVIFSIQVIAGSLEFLNVISCHSGHKDCWPFFFLSIADLPVSIFALKASGPVGDSLGFWGGTLSIFTLLVVLGTVQWSIIVGVFMQFFRLFKH